MDRILLKPPKNNVIYWTKNPSVTCFNQEGVPSYPPKGFEVWANLDRKDGADAISGTSAYLYFQKNMLESVKFQVLMNETMAMGGIAEFTRLCQKEFGPPVSSAPTVWLHNGEVIHCSSSQRDRALFVWKTQRHMQEFGLAT